MPIPANEYSDIRLLGESSSLLRPCNARVLSPFWNYLFIDYYSRHCDTPPSSFYRLFFIRDAFFLHQALAVNCKADSTHSSLPAVGRCEMSFWVFEASGGRPGAGRSRFSWPAIPVWDYGSYYLSHLRSFLPCWLALLRARGRNLPCGLRLAACGLRVRLPCQGPGSSGQCHLGKLTRDVSYIFVSELTRTRSTPQLFIVLTYPVVIDFGVDEPLPSCTTASANLNLARKGPGAENQGTRKPNCLSLKKKFQVVARLATKEHEN